MILCTFKLAFKKTKVPLKWSKNEDEIIVLVRRGHLLILNKSANFWKEDQEDNIIKRFEFFKGDKYASWLSRA